MSFESSDLYADLTTDENNNDDTSTPKKILMNELSLSEILKGLGAWIVLQKLTRDEWNAKALRACSDPILIRHTFTSTSSSSNSDHNSSGPLIVEIPEDAEGQEGTGSIDLDSILFTALTNTNNQVLVGTLNPPSSFSSSSSSSSSSYHLAGLSEEARLIVDLKRYVRFATGAYGRVFNTVVEPGSGTGGSGSSSRNRSGAKWVREHEFMAEHTDTQVGDIYHSKESGEDAMRFVLSFNLLSSSNCFYGYYHFLAIFRSANTAKLLKTLTDAAPEAFGSLPHIFPKDNSSYKPTFYVIVDHATESVVVAIRGTLNSTFIVIFLLKSYLTV
jgi:hypothetical protein